MCMPSTPDIPEYKAPEPLPQPEPLPTAAPAPPPPVIAPPQAVNPAPAAPLAPQTSLDIPTPPPTLAQTPVDDALVKKKKSKRSELQQANKGTKALRIPLNQAIGGATGGTGSTGLNIPK
jgi:hypothetical protein